MSLLDTYNIWKFKPIGSNDATPPKQTQGDVAVNHIKDDYQTGFTTGTPGSRTVSHISAFTTAAKDYYSTLISNNTLTLWRTKQVHKYEATGTKNYLEKIKDTPGAAYRTNQ